MTDFEEKVREWEKSVESVLVDMAKTTNSDGLLVYMPPNGIVSEFMKVVDYLRASQSSGKAYLVSPEIDHG